MDRSEPLSWWALIAGADWRHPQGPDTNIEGLMQHPVVHVAFEDALAYADWVSNCQRRMSGRKCGPWRPC